MMLLCGYKPYTNSKVQMSITQNVPLCYYVYVLQFLHKFYTITIKLAYYKTAIKLHLASARVWYYYYKLLRVGILVIKNNLLLRGKISTNYNS